MALATELSVECEFLRSRRRKRFAITYHGLADIRRTLKLALQAVNENLKMKLAHSGKNSLPRLFIFTELTRRILRGESLHRFDELILVGRALRLDRHKHDWLRRCDALKVARLHF